MSSFRTKVAAAVFTIVALTFGPYAALAQNSWTPPTQAPTGGNVPAPVNVGISDQTKLGPLSIKGAFKSLSTSTLSGDVVTQPDTSGFGFMANFLETFFYNNVYVGDATPFNGSGNEIPVDFNVYGKFKYQTADNAGNPEPVNPGDILVANDEGYTEWADPSTISGGGSDPRLPNGTSKGDTLYWDPTTSKWVVASNVQISPNVFESLRATGTNGGLHVLNDGSVVSDYRASFTGGLKVTLPSGAPTPGQVLETSDNQGNIAWGDGLPPGGNNGDVLVWNSTTNQWESTTFNVTGSLPPGNSTGQSLRWTGTAWQVTDAVKTPSDTTVQIGANASNTAVMIGNTVNTSFMQINSNSLNLNPDAISIPLNGTAAAGKVLASSNNTGALAWTDVSSLPGGLPAGTTGQTLWHNGTSWQPTSKLIWNGAGEVLKFEGSGLLLKGEGGALDPAEGRFLQSKNDQGEVVWNKYFVYKDIPYVDDGVDKHIDSIEILESNGDDTRTSGLANYGEYTYLANRLEVDGLTFLNNDTEVNGESILNGNTTISTSGDLWLEGIDALPPTQMDLNGNPVSMNYNLESLCINRQDFKVVLCDPGAGKPKPQVIGTFTETFGPGSGTGVSFPRPNQAPGPVEVKMCAAGGGGGGGGRGFEIDLNEYGHGGGGGGGGGKGQCSTTTINPGDGEEITWTSIGAGGSGGSPGNIDVVYGYGEPYQVNANTAATSGQPGGGTQVYFEGNLLASLMGGSGGYAGGNASTSGQGIGGSGGSSDLTVATVWWHKGANGQIDSEGGNGGHGGKGEDNASGQGGEGGGSGQFQSGQQFGGNGMQGAAGYGGGGGGGASGKWYDYAYTLSNQNDDDNAYVSHGGWGGNGGSGYVAITYNIYLPDPEPITEQLFTESGTFNINVIPTNVVDVTIEAWGGGGGGGLAQNAVGGLSGSHNRYGGGGGSGGYAKTIIPRANLTNTLNVIVGGGGAASANGGPSSVVGGGQIVTAYGGEGGKDSIQNAACTAGGNGGTNNYGQDQAVDGGDGGACGVLQVNPPVVGAGQGGVQSVGGYGTGGNGAKLFGSGASPVAAQSGQAGRVLISW